ncbi:MAG: TldD/PmbA family protein [Exilispira sp.]
MFDLCYKVLNYAKLLGASYADIRVIIRDSEFLYTKNGKLEGYNFNKEEGYGVRVIVDNGWGFASISNLKNENIEKVVQKAISIAKASSKVRREPIILTKEPAYEDIWTSIYLIDPFTISFEKKLNTLLEIDEILRKEPLIKIAECEMRFRKEHKYFANTEGSKILQTTIVSGAGYEATAIDENDVQKRTFPMAFGGQYMQMGWELIEGLELKKNAPRIASEAAALLKAKEIEPAKRDLIIGSEQLALQIHESCGHPSELDRVLGYEENYAGSSFITVDKYKNMHYGSSIVNLVADSTLPNGLGTFGYDDDGVKAQRYYIVKNGLYQNYFTNREFAHIIGDEASHGCNRADHFSSIPIIRMINLSLLPGDHELDDIISATEDGLFVDGVKTWSIDQMRLNFQFTCEIGYRIKNGKLAEIVKNPTYQGITPQFWQSCDMIANEKYWKPCGVINCGKGQPGQVMMMTHGAAPARFKNVMTGIVRN